MFGLVDRYWEWKARKNFLKKVGNLEIERSRFVQLVLGDPNVVLLTCSGRTIKRFGNKWAIIKRKGDHENFLDIKTPSCCWREGDSFFKDCLTTLPYLVERFGVDQHSVFNNRGIDFKKWRSIMEMGFDDVTKN